MIRNAIFVLVIGTLFLGSALFAGVPLNKQHKGMTGKDDAKVNCAYCHTKAGNPKTTGNDLETLKKGSYCAIKDCHGN